MKMWSQYTNRGVDSQVVSGPTPRLLFQSEISNFPQFPDNLKRLSGPNRARPRLQFAALRVHFFSRPIKRFLPTAEVGVESRLVPDLPGTLRERRHGERP